MGKPQRFRTVCPRNCYSTCGMVVTVDDGKLVSVEGDPENPATAGKICLKGQSYVRRVVSPDRLTSPLRRRGDRFEALSWDDALDQIASKLSTLRDESGAASVLYHEGSGSHGALSSLAEAFWRPYGSITRTHGDLCWPAGLEATRLTYGDNRHSHPRFTTQSRLILLWGHNPAETNIHQMRLLLDAQERGTRLAAIDPRGNDTTDAVDIHLQPRPGTDAALALGMAHVLFEEGLHDQGFLEAHAIGVDEFKARIESWTAERAAEECGVNASQIREVAREIALSRPSLVIAGFGLQRHHHAGQTMRAVCLLPAITGNVGVAGGGWQYANLASFVVRPPPLPDECAEPSRSFAISRLGREIEEARDPPIRAAWFEKANPVSQNPHSSRLKTALGSLDLVVLVDQFLTATARHADIILPAKTMFEQADLVTAYWHPYLQLRTGVLEPPEGVKTESEIWRLLAQRLGFDTRFLPEDPTPLLRSMLPEGADTDALDRLAERPLDLSDNGDVAFADGAYPTPSGRIEFRCEEAARLWGVDPLPDYTPLEEGHASPKAEQFPLQLLTCKTRDRIHSQFGNVDWVEEVERPRRLDIHPRDAAARGLDDGDLAVIFNDRGRVEVPVHIDFAIRPGVVHVIEGRIHRDDPELNLLTDDGITDMNHGATFYECLVEVKRE